ncbi:formate dehydrogenase accessory sulfurtransferase FdhD [Pseudomonas sp.]|uniref:formate dehydrogenase accessory sulfurtransferase FdhD n=1 Tax=Pseudomonas sp. TaxID=306 RepID=UPI002588FE1C|nr:formate dehydrogenase accessory sulfurtransferase FdhD [Pseudomonas sp.]
MHSKYKVNKFKSDTHEEKDDLISIEEPLEISLKFEKENKTITQLLSITMRTPGQDEDLVRGFLYNEQIIKDIKHISSIEKFGEKVGQYNIQNKILVTLNDASNVDITKIKRDFLTNSSCGVCGKSSLDALEVIKQDKTPKLEPKLNSKIIISAPDTLRNNQAEFAQTGGIHASGLFNKDGTLINVKEDVGRHNALDKLIGNALLKGQIDPNNQFITCSGRLPGLYPQGVHRRVLHRLRTQTAVGAGSHLPAVRHA